MKKIILKAFALIAGILMVSSCTEDMEWKDSSVSAPTDLFAPADNQSVTLQSSATASVVFEWGNAHSEDGGAPNYEVVFDKVGGDFSEPLYKVTADVGGTLNKATILHKTLNTVAAMAGVQSGESGAVQWTVIAYRGLNKAQATKSNTVTLTRFFGFDEIPGAIYLIGDAVEGGSIVCGAPANGEFEVFVKLGNGTFTLNTAADGSGNAFCIDGDRIKEGNTPYTVSESGIFRISMDFNVAAVTGMKKIESLGMYHCDPDVIMVYLNYEGNGVWANNVTLPDSGDERYRFHMTYADGSQMIWGAIATNDSRPGGAPQGDAYYKLFEYNMGDGDRWSLKWKWEGDFYGKDVNVTVTFNVPTYTHYVKAN